MTRIATVRRIDGDPAINVDTLPGALLARVRVKGIATGRISHSEILRSSVRIDVYEAIRTHPGITMKEVRELLPQYSRDEIHRAMFVLNGRMIRPSGKQGTINRWQVVR